MPAINLSPYLEAVRSKDPVAVYGKITEVIGLLIESEGPASFIGETCIIKSNGNGNDEIPAEVVGFKGRKVLLMPLGDLQGIAPGSKVIPTGKVPTVPVGKGLLGRVLDGLGNPIDEKGPIDVECWYPIQRDPPSPLERKRITEPFATGVRVIDACLTFGKGQRVGIFAGSGVGKSTLLGMIARYAQADVNVIALVGERGREVRNFLERDLGEDGLAKSVVIVATSDKPPLVRRNGAFVAQAIAEFFRDQGMDVLLMMDSVTRLAMAQREVGLAVGEPPTTKGYTPSVFAMLPRFLERSGTSKQGSITGIYTVLVEGSDMEEPVADALRAILDGHIVLTRRLAHMNHYPAVEVLESNSRVMVDVVSKDHYQYAGEIKDLLATYRESEDLISIGAYAKGSNPKVDLAIAMKDEIDSFLRQNIDESFSFESTLQYLEALHNKIASYKGEGE